MTPQAGELVGSVASSRPLAGGLGVDVVEVNDDLGARAAARRPAARLAAAGAGVTAALRNRVVATVVGVGLLVALWWIVAAIQSGSDTMATPPEVVRAMWNFRSYLWRGSGTTLAEGAIGFVAGNFIGVVLAVGFVQFKVAERAVLQLAIVTHCLPVVAIGPLLELLLTGREPRYVMSALLVFFPTVVTVQLGLRRTDRTALEVVRVYGGRGWAQLRFVRLMNALPYILTALKITAPLALLGAILGEFMGGSGGLGVLIITSQEGGKIARTWGVAMACTLWSLITFGFFSLLTRFVTPWAPKQQGAR